jgi:hypothetical protein
MSDPSGWLWAILAVLGVGGLGLAIAYGSAMWGQRRKSSAARHEQGEAVRDNYRQEEIREKRHETDALQPRALAAERNATNEAKIQPPIIKNRIKTRGGVTGHNVRYVLAFALASTIIAFVVIAIYFGRIPF